MGEKEQKELDIIKNKELIEKYPFLKPTNVWTGEPIKDYDYSYTYLDDMPKGWKKAFGVSFCEDLMAAMKKSPKYEEILKKYRILQVKEKFGELRWYDNGHTKEMGQVIYIYEHISTRTCITCGKINVPIYDDGWICPECDECFEERTKKRMEYLKKNFATKMESTKKNETMEDIKQRFKVDDGPFTRDIHLISYIKGEKKDIYIDCSETLKKMGYNPEQLPYFKDIKKEEENLEDE